MDLWLIILLIVAGFVAFLLIFYFAVVRPRQKQADEQQEQIDATKQSVTIYVIGKKKMRISEAGFPKAVLETTPAKYRNRKVDIVKAKIGPQIVSLAASREVFDIIPVNTNVKSEISGIYIVNVHSMKGNKPLEQPKKKKK